MHPFSVMSGGNFASSPKGDQLILDQCIFSVLKCLGKRRSYVCASKIIIKLKKIAKCGKLFPFIFM